MMHGNMNVKPSVPIFPASEPHLLSVPFPLFQMLEGFPLLHSLTAPYLPVFLNFSLYEQLLQFNQLQLISNMALNGLYTSRFLYVKLCYYLFFFVNFSLALPSAAFTFMSRSSTGLYFEALAVTE
jgi:hypothetical protein